MPVQLMRLRGVPDDELSEILALLDEAGIAHYQTSAGNWGISMPALWLPDDSRYTEASRLLDEYARQRYQLAREEYKSLKNRGEARGWIDIISENPVRFVLYIGLVIFIVWLALVPWFSLEVANG